MDASGPPASVTQLLTVESLTGSQADDWYLSFRGYIIMQAFQQTVKSVSRSGGSRSLE